MAKEYIKDFKTAKVLGYTETIGTKTYIRDFRTSKVIGTYDSRDNITRGFSGKPVGRGNMLTALLNDFISTGKIQ